MIFTFIRIFPIDGYITNSQSDQLPVSLIAQLVNAPVSKRSWVRIAFKPEFVLTLLISRMLKLKSRVELFARVRG